MLVEYYYCNPIHNSFIFLLYLYNIKNTYLSHEWAKFRLNCIKVHALLGEERS